MIIPTLCDTCIHSTVCNKKQDKSRVLADMKGILNIDKFSVRLTCEEYENKGKEQTK